MKLEREAEEKRLREEYFALDFEALRNGQKPQEPVGKRCEVWR